MTKYILIEHADGNDPWQLRIFDTAEERVQATVEATLGPDGKREDMRAELATLTEYKRLHFEGDPSLEWIDADVPQIESLQREIGDLKSSNPYRLRTHG